MKHFPIQSANITYNENGTPVSREFNDVYFSDDDGLEETRYVFLASNKIPERFVHHPRSLFIVAESGFGTGLNFLTLWQAFDEFCQQQPQATLKRLHFVSFEKFPLTQDDLRKAHARWPQLADRALALQEQWPLALSGCHRLLLDQGRVTLDLWFGDINTLIPELDDSLNQQVDAWFLDGFAPAKNPEMWTPGLFGAMAKLAREGSTLATFTCAGFVRRGLTDAGFSMRKIKGFGRKREMLTGTLTQTTPSSTPMPWFFRQKAEGKDIAIIGGGIASVFTALALLRRGLKVTLYCEDDAPAQGASGNKQGALYPLLSAHDPALMHFFPAAFTFARRIYDTINVEFDHAWCGVTQLGWDKKSRQKIKNILALNLPASLVHAVDKIQAEQISGVKTGCGGITYPQGGWLCPAQLTRATFLLAQSRGLILHYQHRVAKLVPQQGNWQLLLADASSRQHDIVVLANGHKVTHFEQSRRLPLSPVGGQVSHIPTSPALKALQQVLCYDGYLTPENPATMQHCLGASYHRGLAEMHYNDADQQDNRQRLINCLPHASWPQDIDVSAGEARCGVRCAIRDHLPMIGSVPDYHATLEQYASLADNHEKAGYAPVYPNLYMLGALGSRGLCSAPLAAEILAAQISGEPQPLDATTLSALNPNRLWVRKLLKGRPVK